MISLLCVCSPAAKAAEERYGRGLLKNDSQRIAYDAIVTGVGQADTQISFRAEGISGEDVQAAIDMVLADYPEYFWFHGGGSMEMTNDGSVVYTPGLYMVENQTVTAGPVLEGLKTSFEEAANAALKGLPKGSDYEKALYLHDYLAKHITYVQEGDHQTAYGALVRGKSVCAGYTRAYQYLLHKAGIRSWYVSGHSMNPATGDWESHAWNLLFLNGKCYYTDVTWDDQGAELFHAFFMLSSEEMHRTHIPNDAAALPASCLHTDMDYFTVKGGKGTGIAKWSGSATAAEFASWMVQTEPGVFTCTISDATDSVGQWLQANFLDVITATKLTGSVTCSQSIMGHEYQFVIKGKQEHIHDASLRNVPAKAAGCVTPGNIAYYVCDSCGAWFEDPTGEKEITDHSLVNIAPSGHQYSVVAKDATHHWNACDCGEVQPNSKEVHEDTDGNTACDSCGAYVAPVEKPTETPTEKPTEMSTEKPTEMPTEKPTEKPTETPTETPTEQPTEKPTEEPTEEPTKEPTQESSEPSTIPVPEESQVSSSTTETMVSATYENAGEDQKTGTDGSLVWFIAIGAVAVVAVIVVVTRIGRKKL